MLILYINVPISEEDKKDPTKLLEAFKKYFKLKCNIFQSWYALGSIYSGAFKTQLEFYHKLNSVANDCNFTNKDEIVKFLYFTHNQNRRVREHLLKELTDTTSLADMLHMARICEGTVHSEEISKQYLESIKTVKQVDAIHQWNNSKPKPKEKDVEAIETRVVIGLNHVCQVHVAIVVPVILPRSARHKQGHFSQFCHSKQCGKSPGSSMRSSSQNNRYSHHDVHEIDQSQFNDSVQFEQDSITIQFRNQVRHTNVMFDKISSIPSLQRVLTDVHVKAIRVNQPNWQKCQFKIDSGAFGNLMPLCMYRSLYNKDPLASTMNNAVHLLDYNKQEIKQLGTCFVSIRFRSTVKCVHFYYVPDRLKPIIGVSDALALGLTLFHCPIFNNCKTTMT